MGQDGQQKTSRPTAHSRPPRKRERNVTGRKKWSQCLVDGLIAGAAPKLGDAAAELIVPLLRRLALAVAAFLLSFATTVLGGLSRALDWLAGAWPG